METSEREKLKAVVYDFDGTLTPEMVPEFKVLERCGMEGGTKNPRFFESVHEMAKQDGIDPYEAMARRILEMMTEEGISLTDENLADGAGARVFNPGVPEFLAFLNSHGVANFLLSSGLKAYLEHLSIAPEFAEIYATTLTYDEDHKITGVWRVMTPEEKAVALGEIASQVNGDAEDFTGIVYVGDGPTDLTAMEHIKAHGGGAIFIQHDGHNPDLPEARDLDVDFVTGPDYSEGGELANYMWRML